MREDPLRSRGGSSRVRSPNLPAVDDALLPDGTYDVFVVDADDAPPGQDGGPPGTTLDLTVTSGPHKAETLVLRSTTWLGDPIDLIGMPATLTVSLGVPSVRIDH